MRVREISYSKKIGLPNYGSLGLSVTAELETNDVFDDTYHDLKVMVDAQLDEVGTAPAQPNGNGHSNGNGHRPQQDSRQSTQPPSSSSDGEPATVKQMELVRKLCQEHNRKVPPGQISRTAASQLINELLGSGNGNGGRRSNGSGSYNPTQRQSPPPRNGNGSQDSEKMTEGQRRYLYRLLSDQGYRGQGANDRLKEMFRVESLAQVTKDQASYEIEDMVQRAA